jgi:integrase
VFKLTYRGKPVNRTRHAVGKYVKAIGTKAGVITEQREKNGKLVNVFATAHDLRRAFGFRWSRCVMPAVLRELMRHESLETTMRYYVGVNAEATADELWAAIGGNLGGAPNQNETEVSKTT